MTNEFLKLLATTFVFCVVLMTIVWAISRRIQNLGVVDVAWSLGFAPVAIIYATSAPGDATRRWLIAAMVVIWSLRLGSHIWVRVQHSHPKEDVRYDHLRKEWAANLNQKVFFFFEFQALLIVALAVPFLLASLNTRPGLTPWEIAGTIIWLAAIVGEGLSDHQLKVFKANPANKGLICQAGLWHYSRHPNYFFEWLIWVAYAVFATGSPWGWITFYCPALMLFFLLKVTGIPLTEQLSLKSKGDQYRAYQKTTSAFVPWFRKTS